MNEISSHLEIALASIQVFAGDGKLDMEELNFLLGLALRDAKVDEDEKRVLGNIFKQVSQDEVSSRIWARIGQVKAKYGIN
ncbi:MAG: hypothetical protein GY832_04285 [Chloroflexi bacterium]|nr:hypothetical protein [Chloroflexota bacterium]